jgi:hypothetical protein
MNEPRVELPDFFLLLLLLRVADSHILAVLLLRTGKQAAALRSQESADRMLYDTTRLRFIIYNTLPPCKTQSSLNNQLEKIFQ